MADYLDDGMPWFETTKGETYKHLIAYIDNVLQANQRRYTDYVRFAALYGNWETAHMTQMLLPTKVQTLGRQYRRLSFNICQSITDTVVNERASEAPDLMAVSCDGDYKQFVAAKQLTRAIKVELQRSKHDQIFPRVCQNTCLFGMGYATVERSHDLRVRRVFSPEIVTDPFDNIVDDWPHIVSHVRFVNKWALKTDYPEKAARIEQAAAEVNRYLRNKDDDNVRVVESWALKRGNAMGKHVVSISTCDLVDLEDYEYDTPPLVHLPWGQPLQGWQSPGLVDQLVGLQMEITETLEIIRDAIKLFAHPFMLVENGANVNPHHIQDIPGKLIKYTNTKPEIVAANIISPEVFQHLERCYQKAYEIAGINMYQAGAKTLPRYESSKAMRAATEQGEVRHFSFAKACERYHVELGGLVCREGAILADETDYKTRQPHSAYFKNISWKEINYQVENYQIDIDTVNKQNNSLASNIQDLEDLAQLQQLSIPELRRYLLNPDLNRVLRHMTASDEYIDFVIYQLAYEEKYLKPDPFMDFQAAFKEVVAEYLTGLRIGMSDKAKENLLNYALAVKQEIDDAQQEQMTMQAEAQMQAQQNMQAKQAATLQQQAPVSTAPGSQQ